MLSLSETPRFEKQSTAHRPLLLQCLSDKPSNQLQIIFPWQWERNRYDIACFDCFCVQVIVNPLGIDNTALYCLGRCVTICVSQLIGGNMEKGSPLEMP